MTALAAAGRDADALDCRYRPAGSSVDAQELKTTSLGTDTRTTHAVATFIAPVSGLVSITCGTLSQTYIDDADNTPGDPAGLFILLCAILLTIGVACAMSALYRRGSEQPSRPSRPTRHSHRWDDEVGESYSAVPPSPG